MPATSKPARSWPLPVSFALLALWMGVIFFFSSETGSGSGARSTEIARFLIDLGVPIPMDALAFLIRKGAHFFVYFILGALAFWFYKNVVLRPSTVLWASLVTVFLYAVSDEIHQLFVDERAGQILDVFVDTAGGATAVLFLSALSRIKSK